MLKRENNTRNGVREIFCKQAEGYGTISDIIRSKILMLIYDGSLIMQSRVMNA